MPIVTAVARDDAGNPRHVKLATVVTFSLTVIADWAQDSLAIGSEAISDGLACFRAVTEVGCLHQPVEVKGRHPNELTEFSWINTEPANLKTSLSDTLHALNFDKYAIHYLGAFHCHFSRHFNLSTMTNRLVHSIYCCARPEGILRGSKPPNQGLLRHG
jgi:hypothetical protein